MKIEKEDERLYLQFLQDNIARMNNNSAQAKGWCIAVVAALLAIFSETHLTLFHKQGTGLHKPFGRSGSYAAIGMAVSELPKTPFEKAIFSI